LNISVILCSFANSVSAESVLTKICAVAKQT